MTKITTAEMIRELEQSTKDLLQAIASFGQDRFNTIPFEGSWTAGQVSEHLLIGESGIPEILKGATLPAKRPPDEKMQAIADIFLDFTTRLKAPEATLPSDELKDKATLLTSLDLGSVHIVEVAGVSDLSRVCTLFPFPVLGTLTGFEWIYFVICHSKRHTRQLHNIYRILTPA